MICSHCALSNTCSPCGVCMTLFCLLPSMYLGQKPETHSQYPHLPDLIKTKGYLCGSQIILECVLCLSPPMLTPPNHCLSTLGSGSLSSLWYLFPCSSSTGTSDPGHVLKGGQSALWPWVSITSEIAFQILSQTPGTQLSPTLTDGAPTYSLAFLPAFPVSETVLLTAH